MSVYSGLIGRPEWAAAKEDHSIELAIVGSWHGSSANRYAEHVLSGARMAGLATATYIVLAEHPEVVTTGLQACGMQAEHLSFVALDCELRGLTEDSLHEAIRLVKEAGHRCVIYTGAWFWAGRLGDPDWASHMPLWDSSYDAIESLSYRTRYGGWEYCSAKQYQGTNETLGFGADLSVFDPEWLGE